jgi:hypothetical protein
MTDDRVAPGRALVLGLLLTLSLAMCSGVTHAAARSTHPALVPIATHALRHFLGTTSQGYTISFTYDSSSRTIAAINTLLRFRCAGGARTFGAYGGFSVHVRVNGTFAVVTTHGYFRGRFVAKRVVAGRILLRLADAEPAGCTSGLVRFTARSPS